jgi:hypothetical protein
MDIHVYWNIFTMHGPMNVKFPNNTSKWQMEFNSEFKGLIWPQIATSARHLNIKLNLHVPYNAENILFSQ